MLQIIKKSPCNVCLIKVCCSVICYEKIKWDSRFSLIILPFMFIGIIICFAIMSIMALVGFILYKLGLITIEQLKKVDPFPNDEDFIN